MAVLGCWHLLAAALSVGGSTAFLAPATPMRLPSPCARAVASCGAASLSCLQRRQNGVSMGLADAVPGRLKDVFAKKQKAAPQRTRTEGAELYRTLGVSPDADYMDVVAACDRLKEKYKGDRKKVITLDKAKDDIMALRLKQAVSGTIKQSEGAQNVDEFLAARDAAWKRKNSKWKVPSWAKGWFEVPDSKHFNQVLFRHGFFALFAAGFPSAATGLQAIGAACNFGTTMNRNAPELKRDENNQIAEVRLPAKKTLLLSFATVCVSFWAGYSVGTALCNLFGEHYLVRESWQGIFIQIGFFVTGIFISTWRDPDDGPKVSRRRGHRGRGPE